MKKNTKRWLSLVLAAVLVIPTGVPARAAVEDVVLDSDTDLVVEDVTVQDTGQEEIDISLEEEDSDFVLGRPMTEEEKQEQMAPMENLTEIFEEPMETEELDSGVTGEERVGAVSYPDEYDLRAYATSVKQQVGETCWAFSTIAAGEANLVMNDSRYAAQNLDLDEIHLAYNSFCPNLTDPLGNSVGDYNYFLSHDWMEYKQVGGSPFIAAMTLSQWKGAAMQGTEPNGSNAYNSNQAILTGFASNIAKNNQRDVKKALTEHGPLVLTYYANNSYYNPDTAAYCHPGTIASVNHAVTIVGWDDHYSKTNFSAFSGVQSDGAWIVKNSWGEDWGDGGYFYLSYEDAVFTSISGSLIAPEFRSADTYDHNYQYDGTGSSAAETIAPGESIANVYQVKGNPNGRETLKAVGFYFYNVNQKVRVQIYKNLKDRNNPSSGTLAYDSYDYGSWSNTFRGYYTYDLEVPVTLSEGTYYSIVITSESENPFNYLAEEMTQGAIYGYHADIRSGQSFTRASADAVWTDNYKEGYCARIKGFTVDDDTQKKANSVKLNKTSLKLKKGSTYQLTASVLPADASNHNLKWSSSNSSVASVDQNGKVTLKGYGQASITAKTQDGSNAKASCAVTSGYAITYKLNGGTNVSGNPKIYYNQTVTLKSPQRKGYAFLGWYTDSKYKNKITSIRKGTGKNLTLYARWSKISVAQVKSTSVKNASSRAMTVCYSKVSGANGYQIVYDTNSGFTTKQWVGRVGTSKTITGLKKGKTYYVKVRAFKTDSTGKRIYGPYSGVKKVKIAR